MAKYLFRGAYTVEGLKGLLKEGGTRRREAVEAAVRGLGGKLEAFYYAFGETDVFAIVEMPDHASTAAFSLVTNAAGTAKVSTTVLMTPEDMDQAVKMSVDYRPPGR